MIIKIKIKIKIKITFFIFVIDFFAPLFFKKVDIYIKTSLI